MPLVSSRGAEFDAVVATTHSWAVHRTGAVTWNITSASDTSVPCHWANNVTSSTTALSSCIVAPGLLRADDGPYTVSVRYRGGYGVTPSSATLTQSVTKASSQVWVRVNPAAPPADGTTVTATVPGYPVSAGTPTGTVTFAVTGPSGEPLQCVGGNAVALTSGTATCVVPPSAAPGVSDVVTATFSGDAVFGGSTSSQWSFTAG